MCRKQTGKPCWWRLARGKESVLVLLLFLFQRGHQPVLQVALRAGGDALHAADAVRVAHKIRAGHVDVHRAVAGALAALPALLGIALDAEDAQHAEQTIASTAGAEIVAERAVEEQRDEQERDDEPRAHRQDMSSHQHVEVVRPLQQSKGDAHGRYQVEGIAQQLQVALCSRGHTQARQVQQTTQSAHPLLRRTEGADPAAEEYTCQQGGRQQPAAHLPRLRHETQEDSRHEKYLYQKSDYLEKFCFFLHVPILHLFLL